MPCRAAERSGVFPFSPRSAGSLFTLSGDGLCVGWDSADAASELSEAPAGFKGGTIDGVAVDVGDDEYVDLETEAKRLLVRQWLRSSGVNGRGANRLVEVRFAHRIHHPGQHLPIVAFRTSFVLRLVASTPLIGRSRSQRFASP